MKLPRRPETGRICAVCGKTRSPSGQKHTYGFSRAIRWSGITLKDGNRTDKAHRECVAVLTTRES